MAIEDAKRGEAPVIWTHMIHACWYPVFITGGDQLAGSKREELRFMISCRHLVVDFTRRLQHLAYWLAHWHIIFLPDCAQLKILLLSALWFKQGIGGVNERMRLQQLYRTHFDSIWDFGLELAGTRTQCGVLSVILFVICCASTIFSTWITLWGLQFTDLYLPPPLLTPWTPLHTILTKPMS